jgi:hypothetical protein
MKKKILTVLIWICTTFHVVGEESDDSSKVQISVGGYAKLDFMTTNFDDGNPANDSPIRDVHIPGFIPVGGSTNYMQTHMHVKQSRINLDANSFVLGKPIHGYVEMDFLFSLSGDERVSNSYTPRLRHYYLEYGKFRFGQDWSTFMVGILPDDIDFTGASEGLVFVRQPQIRFTSGNWQMSVENPSTTYITNGGEDSGTESGVIPDMVVKRSFQAGRSELSVAALIRNPALYDPDEELVSTIGYGITGGGKILVGERDDIRFVATYGEGLGRYLAFNFVPGVVTDDDFEINTIPSYNGYIAYLHHWNNRWRSSVNGSYFMADIDRDLTGDQINKTAFSLSCNLIYQPSPLFWLGAEMMYGYRELENEVNGDFMRLQLSAKYMFNYSSDRH